MEQKACAEIIGSTLSEWTAVASRWDKPPRFGSLVTIAHDGHLVYSVVFGLQTESFDAVHQPAPFGMSHEALQREHPEIFPYLRTIVRGAILGSLVADRFHFGWASIPPLIHTSVFSADAGAYATVYSGSFWLSHLMSAPYDATLLDELVIAMLVEWKRHGGSTYQQIRSIAEQLCMSVGTDVRRCKKVIARMQELAE